MRNIGRKSDTKLRKYQLKILAGLLSEAKNEEETMSLLNTLLTTSERSAIAQRTSILLKFFQGKKYYEIENELGTTASTICKAIDQYLKYGGDNHIFNEIRKHYKIPEYKVESKHTEYHKPLFAGTREITRIAEKERSKKSN